MTEYNYFPAIRFQFEGDTKAAQRRIPQARALMQQLIRRMETTELDALNWRVNTADGYFFEIHKYGDQHIALIRAPARSSQEELPEDYSDYLWIGARVILPEFDPETHPHYTALQGQLAGTIQWNVVPQDPLVWPPNLPLTLADGWEAVADALGKPVQYSGVKGEITNDSTRKIYIPIKPLANLVFFEPSFKDNGNALQSINAYEPYQYGERTTVYQASYSFQLYDNRILFEHEADYVKWSRTAINTPTLAIAYNLNFIEGLTDGRVVIGSPRTIFGYDENGDYGIIDSYYLGLLNEGEPYYRPDQFYINADPTDETIDFTNVLIKTSNGVYSTAPYVCKKSQSVQAHAYLALEPKNEKRTHKDFYPQAKISEWDYEVTAIMESGVALKGDKINDLFPHRSGQIASYTTSITKATAPVVGTGDLESVDYTDPATGTIKTAHFERIASLGHTSDAQATYAIDHDDDVVTDTLATVEVDDPVNIKGKVQEGVYELRLSAGWHDLANENLFKTPDYWTDRKVQCEVTIQLGTKARTYTVDLNMADYDQGQGIFNIGYWRDHGERTPFDSSWYQGCWLIDIKKQTVIHETRPDRLERPWFS